MPLVNGQQGTENPHPEKLRQTGGEGDGDINIDASEPGTEPEAQAPLTPEEMHKSYYAEASLTKKIVVFGITTVLVLIALAVIYTTWH